jgi:hypothetical protein
LTTVLELVFSTNRLEYLSETLKSAKESLDFTGLDHKFLLIDDWPSGRDNYRVTELVEDYFGVYPALQNSSYGPEFPMIIFNDENLGITRTWSKAFRIIREIQQACQIDYILHHEDDVTLTEPIRVSSLIRQLQADPSLSQIALRRGPWYPHEPRYGEGGLPVTYRNLEKSTQYFWSLYSVYPAWVANIDWVGVTGHNPSESVIATYLYNTQGLSTGIYAPNGLPLVNHLGVYSQGQRAAPGEPGYERFKNLPTGKYCSKTGSPL